MRRLRFLAALDRTDSGRAVGEELVSQERRFWRAQVVAVLQVRDMR